MEIKYHHKSRHDSPSHIALPKYPTCSPHGLSSPFSPHKPIASTDEFVVWDTEHYELRYRKCKQLNIGAKGGVFSVTRGGGECVAFVWLGYEVWRYIDGGGGMDKWGKGMGVCWDWGESGGGRVGVKLVSLGTSLLISIIIFLSEHGRFFCYSTTPILSA